MIQPCGFLSAIWLCRFHQSFQGLHILQVVQRLVDGRFGYEGRVRGTRVIQQTPEWLQPDGSLPDVLMAVELRATRCLGIVAVPDKYVLQANRAIELIE